MDKKKFFNKRSLKYGSNSLIMIAIVLTIAVFVNLMVQMLPEKLGFDAPKLDLTPTKIYSIGETTNEIMKKTTKDIEIYALYDESKVTSGDLKEMTELLKKYRKFDKVKLEFFDPVAEPTRMSNLFGEDFTKDLAAGDIVFKSGSKMKKVTREDLFDYQMTQLGGYDKTSSYAEQTFTGAIVYVTSDVTPVIYFTQGHEEVDVDTNFRILKDYLIKNNYDVKNVNLVTAEKVPADCAAIIVASPKRDLLNEEKEKLKTYLKEGGRGIFMFDSILDNPSLKNFDEIFSTYNIALGYDIVKENTADRHIQNQPTVLLAPFESNDINGQLASGNNYVIMQNARSITMLKSQNEFLTLTSLLKTSEDSVAEPFASGAKAVKGPLDLAVAAEYVGGMKPVKFAVYGNSMFLYDDVVSQLQTGLASFIYTLNWMVENKNEVVIAPKSYAVESITINQLQSSVTAVIVVIILPLLILGAGLFVWLRRRHL